LLDHWRVNAVELQQSLDAGEGGVGGILEQDGVAILAVLHDVLRVRNAADSQGCILADCAQLRAEKPKNFRAFLGTTR